VGETTLRTLALVCAAVVVLVFAGAVGAAVRYTIFPIKAAQFAHLSGTDVFCENSVRTLGGAGRFDCARRLPNGAFRGTNAFYIYSQGLDAEVCQTKIQGGECFPYVVHHFSNRRLQRSRG
jgi:hypothetical protein